MSDQHILIIHSTPRGRTEQMVAPVAEGIEAQGVAVLRRPVDAVTWEEMLAADGTVVGNPTRFVRPTSVYSSVQLAVGIRLVDTHHRQFRVVGMPRRLRWMRHDAAKAAAVAQEVIDLQLLIPPR